jgi:Mg2+ and Co2+ transporter CorA
MITVCDRLLPGVQRARALYEQERGPRDLQALIITMAGGLSASLHAAAAKLEAAVADLEYISEGGSVDTSAQLGALRRDVATARRTLAPFKVLAERILTLQHSWLLRDALDKWQRIVDVLRDTDALLQSLHERLISVHDLVDERLSRRMNAVLYRLTIFSTILLPITAITGLFGMNVGVHGASYRFMDGSMAFVLVAIALCLFGWLEYRFMRSRHLLLPSLGELPAQSATERRR